MAISRVGASAGDGTTITIPAGHQAGDVIIIYAFRGATTAPSLPAGWTNITNASAGATSFRCAYKMAISAADTSGTWTNATGLIVHVYRGAATNKTFFGTNNTGTGTGTTVTYPGRNLNCPGTSWMICFAATKTTDSTLETAPTNMTNAATAVGAATEYAGHDTNGVYTSGNWPNTAVVVGGTSAEWRAFSIEILAEQGYPNNYQFVDDNATGDTGILSFTEKVI